LPTAEGTKVVTTLAAKLPVAAEAAAIEDGFDADDAQGNLPRKIAEWLLSAAKTTPQGV